MYQAGLHSKKNNHEKDKKEGVKKRQQHKTHSAAQYNGHNKPETQKEANCDSKKSPNSPKLYRQHLQKKWKCKMWTY